MALVLVVGEFLEEEAGVRQLQMSCGELGGFRELEEEFRWMVRWFGHEQNQGGLK